MGIKAWAAFSCSALAPMAGKADDQQRLFTLGYEQGKAFIEALRSGKIEEKDLYEVPDPVHWTLQGSPSTDFALGRTWQWALVLWTKVVNDRVAKLAPKNPQIIDPPKSIEVRTRSIAYEEFTRANCSIM